jgi:hypothetical protein
MQLRSRYTGKGDTIEICKSVAQRLNDIHDGFAVHFLLWRERNMVSLHTNT